MYLQSSIDNKNQTRHSLCDGRRKSERFVRKDNHCTGCGVRLPDDKSEWGLVWDSKVHGFCKNCLDDIRGYAGVKPKKKKQKKASS